ncbi:diguanylate cyclase [Mesobaculum littorinae]|uniref:diguanylate cyclase n=1 Tax=Mesobaculum littorinae TaxID=2486419 RepID=A0A438AJF8_9RHOB|nr:diguanylate cyclase [Mesobaculum littorinae]RVV98812.1 diguanylate cyclase [Mesobaculum littorinae]
MTALRLQSAALDRLMPMHLQLDRTGRLLHAGPTLRRLMHDVCFDGATLLDLFDVRGLQPVTSFDTLRGMTGSALHLRGRHPEGIKFRGLIVDMDEAAEGDEPLRGPATAAYVLNLSLGLNELSTLSDTSLTAADFPATDMVADMLYLIEANSAAMGEARRLIGRLQEAQTESERLALTDDLTGLGNRRTLDSVLRRYSVRARPFAVTHIDLDDFKLINDTHGHSAGDRVLRGVAKVLSEETRESDTVVRAGGDEFVLILDDITDPAVVERVAARIIARLSAAEVSGAPGITVSGSLGTTLSSFYTRPDGARMLRDADVALYASKAAGRARHVLWYEGLTHGLGDTSEEAAG